jgi:glucokinase
MPENDLTLGIDFGGTSVKIGVVFRSSVIDHAPPIATGDFEGPEELLEEIGRGIDDLRGRHPHIRAAGFGMPGFIDFDHGIIHNLTNVPGWEKFPLGALMEERLEIPVVVDNDANCMAYAEWKRGAGRGMDDVVAVTLGTGVGGGLVSNGRMIRGARFGAGEIGQTSVDWRGEPGHYGNRGSLEDLIGNQQIAVRAHAVYAAKGKSRTLAECSPAQLCKAANRDDEIALEIWDEVARQLACALMNCCWLLNPHAIIVGGGVAKAGDVLFGPLTDHLYEQLSPPFRDHLMVLAARFGNEAGMIGAAAQALEKADGS